VVASKFGEKVDVGDVQLHEFGIVYHRRGPYILGVMTRGRDLARQAEVIRKVSALVYAALEGSEPVEQAR
jgi:CO/xanthine dehydrogenase FAD-binding subunit